MSCPLPWRLLFPLRDLAVTQFGLLVSRRFAPLFLVQFLGAFNDNLYKTALVLFIAFWAVQTEYSPHMVTLAGAVFIAPFLLFSAVAGQLADKYNKARLIRFIKLAEVGIMALAVLGFYTRSTSVLLMALFLMGVQSALFGPLKYGILPQYLAQAELLGGSGLVQMGTYLAILQGTAIGGWLIQIGQGGGGLSALYATMLGVAVCGWLLSLWLMDATASAPDLRVGWNPLREIVGLLRMAIGDHREALRTILSIGWFWFLGAAYLAYLPLYVREVLHGGPGTATFLLAGFTLGVGVGALSCELLVRGPGGPARLVSIGALGLAFFPLDLFLAGGEGVAAQALSLHESWTGRRILFDITMVGLCGGLYIVPLYALLLRRARTDRRARLIAAVNVTDALAIVLSALCVTVLYNLLQRAGLPGHYLFAAIALIHLCCVPALIFPRSWL